MALGKLARTTAFRLSVAYLSVFALYAAFLLGYLSYETNTILSDQLQGTIDAEITGLAEQYRQGGIRRLALAVENRSRRPSASLYLVTDPSGRILSGNVGALPTGILDEEGVYRTAYERPDQTSEIPPQAIVRVFVLPGGFRLLVGRDIGERETFLAVIRRAAAWSLVLMILLGVFSAWFVSRRVLRRIDAMSATSRRIMDGNLSDRIALAGTGDEFDRLAENLNAMLERIDELMRGLKEVSDNIAHDLKTPLTRLRSRAEAALRETSSPHRYREALEATIEESDQLIRTFNALLMIARVEAGADSSAMREGDAAAIVRDVVELYEPLAEDCGAQVSTDIPDSLPVVWNVELVGQAVANLVDNAIKYAKPKTDGAPATISVTLARDGDEAMITVADNGPGIPESERTHVLKRFVRLEESRSEPGSGLGLSLVAAVARMHGGAIEFADARPGLKAILRLPVKAGERAARGS